MNDDFDIFGSFEAEEPADILRPVPENDGSRRGIIVARIRAERPDLAGKRFFATAGGHNIVMMAGGEVFKAPLQESWLPSFRAETAIQKFMFGQGLPVPEVTFVGKGGHFFAMKKMKGVTLNDLGLPLDAISGGAEAVSAFRAAFEEASRKLPDDIRNLIAEAERAAPTAEAESDEDFHQAAAALKMPEVRLVLDEAPGLSEKLKRYIAAVLKRDRVLTNNDTNTGNVMVDPKTRKVCGFIDFGQTHMTRMPEKFVKASAAAPAAAAYIAAKPDVTEEMPRLARLTLRLQVAFRRAGRVNARDVRDILGKDFSALSGKDMKVQS